MEEEEEEGEEEEGKDKWNEALPEVELEAELADLQLQVGHVLVEHVPLVPGVVWNLACISDSATSLSPTSTAPSSPASPSSPLPPPTSCPSPASPPWGGGSIYFTQLINFKLFI